MYETLKKAFSFCIIGGGLTGTSMLLQLVEEFGNRLRRGKALERKIEIHVFEKNEVFGPGFPHSDQQAKNFHLINMCARDMSIRLGKPDDLLIWVEGSRKDLERRFPGLKDPLTAANSPDPGCLHYPRPVMGEYLKARFMGAVSQAQEIGIGVRLHPGHEVINVLENAHKQVRITARHLASQKALVLFADRVLLATGHWSDKKSSAGYFASPWPATFLQSQIPKGADVAIIGTSLSAIDAVLTLTSDGSFKKTDSGEVLYFPPSNPRRLTLYSRQGMLPAVRGRNGSYKNRFLNRESIVEIVDRNGELTLKDVFLLLNKDLERAYGHAFPWGEVTNPGASPIEGLERHIQQAREGDGSEGELLWQTVLQQLFPMVRRAYLALNPDERIRFERHYKSLFFVHAAPMPMINGVKLLALMRSGLVKVRKVAQNPPFNVLKDRFLFAFRSPKGSTDTESHSYVVDARGQSPYYNQNNDPLAQNLLRSGTVEIEPFRGKDRLDECADKAMADSESRNCSNGSLWVDPLSHLVLRTGEGGSAVKSSRIYAVGAMTRGQIIDASMAHGSARSTKMIAHDWVDLVFP